MPATARGAGFTAPAHHLVGDSPMALAAGDFNGDADADLAVVNQLSYDVSVLLGGAGGSFGPASVFAVGLYPTSIAVADFNADADADLAVANGEQPQGPDTVSVLLGGPGGSFGTAAGHTIFGGPRRVAVGDFNGDLDPDLAVTNGNSDAVSVKLGAADATFGAQSNFAVGDSPFGLAVADFNGDNDLDIAVAAGGPDSVSVILGGTDPLFGPASHLAVGDNPVSVAAGDLNGDSDPDLAVTNMWSRNVSVLLGGAGGSFGAAANLQVGDGPSSVAIADFDGDGKRDLAVANGFEPSRGLSVLRGNGDGTFGPETRYTVQSGAGAVVAADFNGDGDPDVALANSGSDVVSVLLNTRHRPGLPTLAASDPGSPANENAPKVRGQADGGTTVRLYTTPDCTGAPAATGSAADFASPGLAVSVPDDSTTTFKATATNAADVPSECSTSSLTFIEHSSPPSAALAISPNPGLTAAVITFDASASTGFGITRYEWDLNGDGVFELDTGAGSRTQLAFAAPGQLNPGVRVSNDLGASVARAPLSIRLAPPPGPLGASINHGDQFTNDADVTVSAVWPALASTVLISNDGGFANAVRFPVAKERAWTLDSSGPERLPKTVYVRFDDTSQTFTDDIILDETPPQILGATTGGAGAGAAVAAKVRTRRLRITARDRTSGVDGLQITSNRRRPGKLRAYKRTSKLEKTVRFRTSSSRIYVRARDAAGNFSRWRKVTRRR